MTLIHAILKKVASTDLLRKYSSPPPELNNVVLYKHKKRNKYFYVKASVDSAPPSWIPPRPLTLQDWNQKLRDIYTDNIRLLIAIKKTYLEGGKVDSHWTKPFLKNRNRLNNRICTLRIIQRENEEIYKRLKKCRARVATTASLLSQWEVTKQEILQIAQCRFVLFPITPKEDVEDSSFVAPKGVKRPRVYITLRTRGAAILGTLTVELFSDVCPNTCKLFTDLLDGDGLGYGYVGTQFFRKVPHLFWSGGDVIYDNGFGCYAQRGRRCPIGAENYHFSHSMPGLLSMRMTADDEMCGVFTITFKQLPQLDLKSVVFGRIVRPCSTYDIVQTLGSPLSTRPHIEVFSTKRRSNGVWISGSRNTKLFPI